MKFLHYKIENITNFGGIDIHFPFFIENLLLIVRFSFGSIGTSRVTVVSSTTTVKTYEIWRKDTSEMIKNEHKQSKADNKKIN